MIRFAKPLAPVFLLLLLGACTATHERPMNQSEKTMLSDQVTAMLDENGGELDIRDHDNVRCERIKITGSHLVTRICYTKEEMELAENDNRGRMQERFGKMKCLDQSSFSCKTN